MSSQKAESSLYISSLPASAAHSTTSRHFFVVVVASSLYLPPTFSPSVRLLYWPRNGPLHSFCSRGSRHYNIRCWPDYCRPCRPCRRPDIPSNTACQPAFSLFADCMDSMSLARSPLLTFTASRTKPSLTNMLVGPRLATTNATLPLRTSSLCARPLSSMTSLVSSTQTFSDTWIDVLFRLLLLCPFSTQFDHSGH